ncbi:MAG: hypothetical protein JNM70_10200 [Anaerolineae bacterium]|nr:hypothetical protein [Anaerolineae bacterium]
MSDPENPILLMLRVLALSLLTAFLVVRQTVTPIPPDQPTFRSMAVIEDAQAAILESNPVQIEVSVRGYHPDGCDFPAVIEQRREGNRVVVEIFRNVPLAATCPMMLNPYQATFRLEGTFDPGQYVIEVNGVVIDLTI